MAEGLILFPRQCDHRRSCSQLILSSAQIPAKSNSLVCTADKHDGIGVGERMPSARNRADPCIESTLTILTTRTWRCENRPAASTSQLPSSFSARLSNPDDDYDALPVYPPTC